MKHRLPFEELFSQVGRFLPRGALPLGAEVTKNLRALLAAALEAQLNHRQPTAAP